MSSGALCAAIVLSLWVRNLSQRTMGLFATCAMTRAEATQSDEIRQRHQGEWIAAAAPDMQAVVISWNDVRRLDITGRHRR
jgi:hypothetical protein